MEFLRHFYLGHLPRFLRASWLHLYQPRFGIWLLRGHHRVRPSLWRGQSHRGSHKERQIGQVDVLASIFDKGSISLRRHDYQKYVQDFINPWAKRMLYLLWRPKPCGLFGEARGQKGVTNFNLPSCSCFSLLFTKSGPLTVFCKYERVSIYKKWYCCQNM